MFPRIVCVPLCPSLPAAKDGLLSRPRAPEAQHQQFRKTEYTRALHRNRSHAFRECLQQVGGIFGWIFIHPVAELSRFCFGLLEDCCLVDVRTELR